MEVSSVAYVLLAVLFPVFGAADTTPRTAVIDQFPDRATCEFAANEQSVPFTNQSSVGDARLICVKMDSKRFKHS